ncbi:Phosphoenolpyruvate/pyruvate domain-containing protein [Corynespora cassiicola Philippines]|uniref:Phosphoenolpyruvate/pyruvate domain-containing protein n=1 Tax=Corynespora cassiicola Philippines TaxID=1448308 RepID=A0A2T2P5A8_CORCC|nr:Phosphoenolpyruvate/pyruvate domain-containing protein [Corynespora cassiicola Philippines]
MVLMQSIEDIHYTSMNPYPLSSWRPIPLGRPNSKPINSSPLRVEAFGIDASNPHGEASSTEGSVSGDDCSDDSASTAPSEHTIDIASCLKEQDNTSPGTLIDNASETPEVQIRAPEVYDPLAPAATRLRYMIKNHDHIIKCPGVYDGLSARIAIDVGFEGMYMTGAGTTASRLGQADLGIAQLHDMRTNAEMIANLRPDGPPLIADMDTGYGGPLVVARSLQQYHLAGVAGFHIEDQIMNKRCGHLAGKEVVDTETYIQRIKACIVARAQLRSDIVIIARTDALQSKGFDDCIERLKRARDEGADMGILEGVKTKEQAALAAKLLAPWPLCYNSVENGHSPLITAQEAQDMGYRIIIYSFAGISPAYVAIKSTFEWLKETGSTGSSVTPKTIFNVCGLNESIVIDEASGGTAFAKGV